MSATCTLHDKVTEQGSNNTVLIFNSSCYRFSSAIIHVSTTIVQGVYNKLILNKDITYTLCILRHFVILYGKCGNTCTTVLVSHFKA